MLDADCDHRAKTQRTLSKDTAGSSQQAGPVDPSDDAYKKVAASNDINIARAQEAELFLTKIYVE